MEIEKKPLTKKEAIAQLWRRGELRHKCHAVQKEMYDSFYAAPRHSRMVWLVSRQTGKSYLLALLALEQSLRKPGSIVKMVTDTKIHIQSIFERIFKEILDDCPEDISPNFKAQKHTYYFPNGSQIQLAGTDNGHFERLRGQKSELVLVDEAGFCNKLTDVVMSVLFPTTTHTGGKIVLASTAPADEDHEFIKFIEEAEANDRLTKKTIYENPLLTTELRNQIIVEMGGVGSTRFRREYLCQIIKSTDHSVVPEFDEDLEKQIVKQWPKPPFFDSYESMDLGGKDLTVVLFAYYDFRADKIIIEDELVVDFRNKDESLAKLVEGIRQKEKDCWYNTISGETKRPYMRVSDINYIVTDEIRRASQGEINFTIAKKDDKDASIQNLRTLLSGGKIIIDPKCVTLRRHLRNVKWDKSKNKFARSPDNGHYDAVDAAIYLVRHIMFAKNPYPPGHNLGLRREDAYVKNKDVFNQSSMEVYRKIFNISPRKVNNG